MFSNLGERPADSILALIKAFQMDERPDKVDLGAGVYRDEHGHTPVMRAVKRAEGFLLEHQDSKCYLGPEGDMVYTELLKPIIFGAESPLIAHSIGIQTPGGCGALRLGAEFVALANPDAHVWLGTPGWPNHRLFFEAGRVPVKEYPFINLSSQSIEFDRVIKVLENAASGDVILLHGSCHNPTGINFSVEQWRAITALVAERHLVPFVDLAYQGLGAGLEQDAGPMREMFDAVDEGLLAYSNDKNFGLYRERVGALFLIGKDSNKLRIAADNMIALAGVNWSMPSDHGAAIVHTVLESAELSAMWHEELEHMCARVNGNRVAIARAHEKLSFIESQSGLFSNLKMTQDQAIALRQKHAVYFVDSGRLSLAGMQPDDAGKIVSVLRAEGVL